MRVLLISDGQGAAAELEQAIIEQGHQLVGMATFRRGFVQHLAGLAIDLIIMDVEHVSAAMLRELRLPSIPVVIFAARQGDVASSEVIGAGVSAYVVDGFKKERLAAVIELALARFNQIGRLQAELSSARQALEERKDIDRAKGIIMKQKGCGEEEAYQALRKTAMDQNRRIGEVAKNIVTLAGLLG